MSQKETAEPMVEPMKVGPMTGKTAELMVGPLTAQLEVAREALAESELKAPDDPRHRQVVRKTLEMIEVIEKQRNDHLAVAIAVRYEGEEDG